MKKSISAARRPTYEEIAQAAYCFYEERGRQPGHEVEDARSGHNSYEPRASQYAILLPTPFAERITSSLCLEGLIC